MKKLARVAVAVMLFGIALCGLGMALSGGDLSDMNIDTELINVGLTPGEENEYTYSPDDVERVSVDAVGADVFVGYTDGILIEVTSNCGVEFAPPENGVLTLREGGRGSLFILRLFDFDRRITVLLPRDMSPDLVVSTVSGDATVAAARLGHVTLSSTSGDISVDSLDCGSFSAVTVSGDVDLGTVLADDFSAETTSGDVDFDLVDAVGGVSLSSVSGDLDGILSGSREDYRVTASTVSGDCSLRSGGNGKIALEASTVSGDIDVEFDGTWRLREGKYYSNPSK